MDRGIQEHKEIAGSSGQASQEKGDNLSGNLGNSDDGVELGTLSIKGLNSGEMVSQGEESMVLNVNTKGIVSIGRMVNPKMCDGSGASESSNKGNDIVCEIRSELGLGGRVTDREEVSGRGNGKAMDQVVQGSVRYSTNLVDRVVLETVIVIDPKGNPSDNGENERLEVKGSELGMGNVKVDKPKAKVLQGEKQSCVIDFKCGGGKAGSKDVWDGEKICRICHLSTEGSLESATTSAASANSLDLIQLGCGCKDELGIAHSHCAEAWFKLRGNRVCEICGETAKNVTGILDNTFMQQWNDRRFRGNGSRSSDRRGGCWRGQPFCNFLMTCLVIAFVLPWFFRVKLF